MAETTAETPTEAATEAAKEAATPAQLIEFIVKSIVNQPDDVTVHERDGGNLLELETAEDDRGRVIGRQGRVAKAMRAVLGASSAGADCRLDIVD